MRYHRRYIFSIILRIFIGVGVTVIFLLCGALLYKNIKLLDEPIEKEEEEVIHIGTEEFVDKSATVVDDNFIILPETTYILQKDSGLRMYVDLVFDNKDRIFVNADAYHNDNHMTDMMFKEFFYKDEGFSHYINLDNTIRLQILDKSSIAITDNRDVSIKFQGTFKRIELPENDIIEEYNTEEYIEEEQETIIEEPIIDTDFYVSSSIDESIGTVIRSRQDFYNFVDNESNEKQKIIISGVFKEATGFSGSRFTSLDGAIVFYVFGVGDCSTYTPDMKVTMSLIYRGRNPRYNGLDFSTVGGNSEYCFNLDNLKRIE